MDFLAKLFSFEGRIGRGTYWFVGLIQGIGGLVLLALSAIGELAPDGEAPSLWWIGIVPLVWIGLAASVKRAHDRDHSGFWLLVGLIPVVGPLWVGIELGRLAGSPGDNRFGAPPGVVSIRGSDDRPEPTRADLDDVVARWKASGRTVATVPVAPSAIGGRPLGRAVPEPRVAPATGFGRRGLR